MIDKLKTVASCWKTMADRAFESTEISKSHVEVMERFFYCGATAVFSMFEDAANCPETEAVAYLTGVRNEIDSFLEKMRSKYAEIVEIDVDKNAIYTVEKEQEVTGG